MAQSSSSPQPSEAERQLAAEFNTIRGRICGLIESFGLPERQERAAITTFKSLSYDAQASLSEYFALSQPNPWRLPSPDQK